MSAPTRDTAPPVPRPPDETARLAALRRYELVDTASEAAFDRIVELAASVFGVPIALVSLMDADRQWYKARCGIAGAGTQREVAFCRFTILADEVMVVPDARLDPRFADNPFVTGEPGIRFYAGAPLHTADGFNIGTVCLIDTEPRPRFGQAERRRLAALAAVTMELIEARLRGLHAEEHAARAAAEHQRLTEAIEAMPAAFALFDAGDRLTLFNRRYAESFFRGAEDRLEPGIAFDELLHRHAALGGSLALEGRRDDWIGRRLELRRTPGRPFEVRLSDGRWMRAIEHRTAEGGTISINVDVTELKERERDLQRTTALLRATMDGIGEGISVFDPDLRLSARNDRFLEMFELPPEFGRIGTPLAAILRYVIMQGGVGDPARRASAWLRQARRLRPFGVEHTRPSGRVLEIRGNPMPGGGFVATSRDISERRRAEERLRQLVTFQRTILDSSANATIVATDVDGTITAFNAAAERLLGYRRDDVVGRMPMVALHDPAEIERRASRITREVGWRIEPGLEVLVGEARAGRTHEGEWTYVREDGSGVPMFLSIAGLRDDANTLTGFLAVGADVSEFKKIDRLKSEFISTVSHELRTPLTSIKGSLGLLLGGLAGPLPEPGRQMVEIAAGNTDRLIRLINDILDIEKIESGRMSFRQEVLDLGPLLANSIEQNQAYADHFGVRLELAPVPGPLRVEADGDRLLQVMANLLSNASKFSPPGGAVTVAAARHGDNLVRVSVTDRGGGVPEEFRGRIFQKFAQADSSDTRQRGGTGLGLSICKVIVERLGGAIGFTGGAGAGTVFYFDLPLRREAAAPASREPEPAAVGRVLVCEDDPDTLHLLEAMLRSGRFEVDAAPDIRTARRKLAEGRYDAMTLDLLLPDGNGLELLRELRRSEGSRRMPVVVVSASARQGRGEVAGAAFGVADWLDKPFDRVRLVEAVGAAVASCPPGRRARVLHVEDDGNLRRVIDAALRDDGVTVDGAADLREAGERLRHGRYDLVLLDLGLPDGAGLEVLRHLTATGHGSTPVVIFSASDATDEVARTVAAQLIKSRTTVDDLRAVILANLAEVRRDRANR